MGSKAKTENSLNLTQSQRANLPLQVRAEFLPSTVDRENRTVDFVISTDKMVEIFDWGQWRMIHEVLPSAAAEYPEQIPLLDCHSRFSTEDQIGSGRNIRVDGNRIIATAHFASDEKSVRNFEKVADGHITDTSIGYRVLESKLAEKDETISHDGKSYVSSEMPLRVATRYQVKEMSLTPIGANDEAKVRSYLGLPQEVRQLPEQQQKKAVIEQPKPVAVDSERSDEKERLLLSEARKKAAEEARREEQDRTAAILEVCAKHGIDAQDYIRSGVSVNDARADILEKLAERRSPNIAPNVNVEMVVDHADKKREYVENSLSIRMGMEQPHKGECFSRSLLDLAKISLRASGVAVDNMADADVARMAVRAGSFSHATGDFPNLLANTLNKRLQMSFEQTPVTWQLWCRSSEVRDFKEVSVARMSESEELDLVPEGGRYPEQSFSDEKEAYTLKKYGKIFSITWESLINDDLRAFETIAMKQGDAAARKVNSVAYEQLTSNPTMSDGTALFHADHNNLAAGSALSATSLSELRTKMRLQKGLKDVTLNIIPWYLLVPAELEDTALQLVNSQVVPGANQGHSANVHQQRFQVVVDPLLSANSATAWYLASRWQQQEHVEVAFLEGHRAPFTEEFVGENIDGRSYKIRMPVVAKAIDHRGVAKNPGA